GLRKTGDRLPAVVPAGGRGSLEKRENKINREKNQGHTGTGRACLAAGEVSGDAADSRDRFDSAPGGKRRRGGAQAGHRGSRVPRLTLNRRARRTPSPP